MQHLSDFLRRMALPVAAPAIPAATPAKPADPNDDPEELFEQVRPLLVKMGLSNMADRMNTKIVTGQTQGNNSLYCVLLRRNSVITPDTVERIKRNSEFLKSINWTAKALEVYVWFPYVAPEAKTETKPAVTPMAPK